MITNKNVMLFFRDQADEANVDGIDDQLCIPASRLVGMIDKGIIDPVLVTKSALKNAVSVVSTIISADCVISNMRMNESN